MDTKKTEVLLRALELGSFSKAAEEYFYTPSAVSHIADALEAEIGMKIFKRTFSGVSVESGAEEIVLKLKEIDRIKKEIYNMASNAGSKKSITVCTYASLMKDILPTLIKGFRAGHPETDINITVGDKLYGKYKDGETDIIFGEWDDVEGAEWEELFSDSYVAVYPENSKNFSNPVSKEELSKETFIITNESKVKKYMKDFFQEHTIKINSHDDSAVIRMVREGVGVAVLPKLSVTDEKGILCAELKEPLERKMGIMYKKSDYMKIAGIKKFVEYTKKYFRKKGNI